MLKKISYPLTAVLCLSCLCLFWPNTVSEAQKQAAPQEEEEVKTVVNKRQVSGILTGINYNFIAVQYGLSADIAREVALTMDKNTKFNRTQYNELGQGDTVRVIYNETAQVKKGEKPRILSRVAILVELQAKAKKIDLEAEPAVLDSQRQEQTGR